LELLGALGVRARGKSRFFRGCSWLTGVTIDLYRVVFCLVKDVDLIEWLGVSAQSLPTRSVLAHPYLSTLASEELLG
jgi:hypothetical protein